MERTDAERASIKALVEEARISGGAPTRLEEWEDAVKRSYRFSVSEDEYAAKTSPERIRMVAMYLKGTYGDDQTSLLALDDTSDEEPNLTVELLFDFMAFGDEYDPLNF